MAGHKVKSRMEYQFCQTSHRLAMQSWVGVTNWQGQVYQRFVCKCDGSRHVNRIRYYNFSQVDRRPEHSAPAFFSGRSIFGQTLVHR